MKLTDLSVSITLVVFILDCELDVYPHLECFHNLGYTDDEIDTAYDIACRIHQAQLQALKVYHLGARGESYADAVNQMILHLLKSPPGTAYTLKQYYHFIAKVRRTTELQAGRKRRPGLLGEGGSAIPAPDTNTEEAGPREIPDTILQELLDPAGRFRALRLYYLKDKTLVETQTKLGEKTLGRLKKRIHRELACLQHALEAALPI